MSGSKLLSIVIPSRNREDYAEAAIRSILASVGDEVEVVVEDNSDAPALGTLLANVQDARLRYRYSPGRRSMSENYDAALGRARGEYVCMIGDDDAVVPDIGPAVAWAHQECLDVLVPTTPATYTWPDLQLAGAAAMRPGELRVHPFNGMHWYPDTGSALVSCAAAAGQSFGDLPKLYYGIVRRAIVQRVRDRTGTYFPGVSPDLAGAVGVAQYAGRVCKVDYPLFLPGSSARSNAGLSGRRMHIGRLRDQAHLAEDVEDTWSEIVPRFYSVETIWAEAFVQAATALDRGDLLREFNVGRLYAHCLTWHPEFARQILPGMNRAFAATGRSRAAGMAQFGSEFASLWALRAKFLIKRLRPGVAKAHGVIEHGLPNVGAAVAALTALLARDPIVAVPWNQGAAVEDGE